MHLDHVVIWVDDPLASLSFYTEVVGLEGVRVDEFRAGQAPFPSVRVSPVSIIDLTPRTSIAGTEQLTDAIATAGHPVNHVCLTMTRDEYDSLATRLAVAKVDIAAMGRRTYGAQGWAPKAFYFRDPDGNVLEARYYERDASMSR